jgi:hypothetical protein
MRSLFVILVSIICIMEIFSQSKSIDRKPVAAGRFYAANPETLKNDVARLFSDCKKPDEGMNPRAIIVPHAGYVFSGKIAASSFSVTPKNATYENIFLIGSSHVMSFDGASVYSTGDFITPLGKITVNREIGEKLKKENPVLRFPPTAHLQDHCLEVQIPLIQYYYSVTPKIVPVIIGTTNPSDIKKIAEALRPWFTPENLFVISSDFSHYPSYEDGNKADHVTSTALASGDPLAFLEALRKNSASNIHGLSTSMCGWTSGLALLYLAGENNDLEFKKLDYCNSGDSPYGNKDEVVGYHAIALVEKKGSGSRLNKSENEFSFTGEEKKLLFEIARNSIKSMLSDKTRFTPDVRKLPEALKRPLGAFVTLKINGVLRGCIGRFVSTKPLYELVGESAISSAFNDPRFPDLTVSEYENVEMEITVLGPMRKISDIGEIKLGKHGIYLKKGMNSGTMLPQVATEHGWSVEEFLGYTARDKAGLGWDGWKTADIFIYDGLVLEEKME